MQSIDVCGRNNNFALREKSNHKTRDGDKYIYPPFKSEFNPSEVISYSIYDKTVAVTKDGVAHAIGDNSKSQISGSLRKKVLQKFSDINIKDAHNKDCLVKSAVCGGDYALYLITPKDDDSKKQLAYSHTNLEKEYPFVLNIGESIPIAIFGGYTDCAAITSVGSIIYIHELLYQSMSSSIIAVSLPGNEKAVSVVCCYDFVIVLGISGRVYESKKDQILLFTEIPELKGKGIKSISGIYQHCFAVSNDGKVYVRGKDADNSGCLCLGKNAKSPDKFKEVKELSKYNIEEAYAGTNHSLFKTSDGKLLGCGDNRYGQILLASGPCKEKIYKPVETIVTNASYCVLGDCKTVIFKDCEPRMNPNREIKKF